MVRSSTPSDQPEREIPANPYRSPAESIGNADRLPMHDPSAPRTNARFVVLGLLCLLSGILYLDRICISQAMISIQAELGISNTQSGLVMMAFTLAYGLFEIPTGRWGDRLGARRVLTRISLWWSFFTALTGACSGLWTLVVVRFLFGAGEAGAFPNVARVMSRWFPDRERGRAQGLLLAASQIGGALAPFLAALLIGQIGWRWTFAVFGSVGAVWAAGFYLWFRDDPDEHPAVNAAEANHIGRGAAAGTVHGPVPWGLVIRNPSIWFLSLITACGAFNSYIYFSWLPKYLNAGRGVAEKEAALMASVVLGCSALGIFSGGFLVDRAVQAGSMSRRRILGGMSFFAASVLLVTALRTQNSWVAISLTALSCGAAQSTQPLWWSCATQISGRHIGALFGLMNSVGVFGALSSQYLVGAIADFLGKQGFSGRAQWDPIFYIDSVVLLVAAVLWSTFISVPVEPAAESEEPLYADH